MPIRSFRAQNFRCLQDVEFEADANYNLVYGANASGKTSLLEALSYLGRGKSFRGAPTGSLVRHGEAGFLLVGKVEGPGWESTVGVRNGREGLEVRIDGDSQVGVAELAEALPLQVIDPEVHELVSGGPDGRRRFLDWAAFHVEHGFLEAWRRYRRALKQRNAALKDGGALEAWTHELVQAGLRLDALRGSVAAATGAVLERFASEMVGAEVRFSYRRGWAQGKSLEAAVEDSLDRDRQQGATQAGPHRADLAIEFDERQARRLVSRGQQKLLACAMVLGSVATVQAAVGKRLLLLLDDPAAELDPASLGRLMASVFGLECQVVATALDPEILRFPSPPARFHVEHGRLTPATG